MQYTGVSPFKNELKESSYHVIHNMAALQMSAEGTWNVECHVCGKTLGSNKDLCGKAAQGKKKVSRPPCVWAHTDSTIVAKCVQEQQKRLKRVEEEAPKKAEAPSHFAISAHVYVAEVASTGIIRALVLSSDRKLVTGYTIEYDDVGEYEDGFMDHSARDVYRILDSEAIWPADASMQFMANVIGMEGVGPGVKIPRVDGSLVQACVDLKGCVRYYGIRRRYPPPAIFYCHTANVMAKPTKEEQLAKAAADKEKESEAATEQARQRLAGGWRPSFEEDNAEEEKSEQADTKVPTIQQLNEQMANLKKLMEPSEEPSTRDRNDGKHADANAEEDAKNTNWTHQSRMMFYGWVAKLNPFRAVRGQAEEAWKNVAEKVADSTKELTRKEGRIELGGNALRVFLAKQMHENSKFGNYKKQLKAESALSGQAGMLSNHETLEFNLLDQLAGMKKEAQEDTASLKDDKNLLKSIKDNQMNDQIYARAMAKPEFKAEMFKALNKKRKTLEIKIEALITASKRPRAEVVALQLSEEERKTLQRHEELKVERRSNNEGTTDAYDSDDNANRSNQKKGRFHETLAAISNLEAKTSRPQEETVLERTLTQWLLQKMDGRTVQQQAPQMQDIKTRLKRLDEAKAQNIITQEEHAAQRARILSTSF